MKAIVAKQDLSLKGYRIDEIPLREPLAGEVVVQVHSAGVSFVDVLIATGGHHNVPDLPYVPGSECAGVIVGVGEGVDMARIGERVCVMADGGVYAEKVITPSSEALCLPAGLAFSEAAILQVNYITAYHALVERACIGLGDTVLVLGAGGGVGSASLQLAGALGANVIASASTAAKRQAALGAGAAYALDSSSSSWREDLRSATGGRGIDVVIDPVCGPLFEPAFRSLAWGGRYMVVGFAAGNIPSLKASLPLLKGASLMGVESKQALARDKTLRQRVMASVFDHYRRGTIKPAVGTCFDAEEFVSAMIEAQSGTSAGHNVIQFVPE